MTRSSRSAFIDAVIVATLAGVLLSSLIGCASCDAHKVAAAMKAAQADRLTMNNTKN